MPKVVDVQARRRELADAAARLIARSGVAAATVRDVAAEAGWTTGALTHYFADKRELLKETFQHSLAQRHARPDDATDPEEHLRRSLERSLPTDDESRRHWLVTMALCAQAGDDAELLALQRDAYREHRRRVAQRVERAGWATGRDALPVAEQLIAVVDGVALQALFDPQGWPAHRQLAGLRTGVAAVSSCLPRGDRHPATG